MESRPRRYRQFEQQSEEELSARFRWASSLVAPDPSKLADADLQAALQRGFGELELALEAGGQADSVSGFSLLDLMVEAVRRMYRSCEVCERRCQVDRMAGEEGVCRLPAGAWVYNEFLHYGEELDIIPAHTVFLTGCDLRCVYCSDWNQVIRTRSGQPLQSEALAATVDRRRREGGRSLEFVGGLPDVNLLAILELLNRVEVDVPVVWNSDMLATPEAMQIYRGCVDLYLADLKYGDDDCAQKLSKVEDYSFKAQRNLKLADEHAPLLVRHLILPGHVECCAIPVVDWLREHLPGVRVNLMDQYAPTPKVASDPLLGRRLESEEYERVARYARQRGGLLLDAS